MIVKQIHIDSVDIHDHTIAEIFCDQDSKGHAAIFARIAKTVLGWESPWENQCRAIARDLKDIKMDADVKTMLQTLVDYI